MALLAALPVLVVLLQALVDGWAPEGDRAVVAVRAYDVFSAHPPLVGAWSTTTFLTGVNTYSPGPLLYWLLAIPAHLPGLWALPTTIAVVNGASVIGCVLLARRRGGPLFMVIVAAAIVVMLSSLPTDLPSDIWAPSAPVLPFTLLVIVGWSLACGDVTLLPLAVLLTSFTVQCHFAYLLPALAILLVGAGGLAARRRSGGRSESQLAAPAGDGAAGAASTTSPPSVRRWVLIALIVAVVCWSLPVLDQVLAWTGRGGHGNFAHLVNAANATHRTIGLRASPHAVVHTIGFSPWWLRRAENTGRKAFEVVGPTSVAATASTLIFLAALLMGLVAGWRRRRPDVASACALALLLIVAVVLFTANFPSSGGFFFTYGYTTLWLAPVGMWVWLLLGWSLVSLTPVRPWARIQPRVRLAAVITGALLAIPVLGLKTRPHAVYPAEYPALRTMMADVHRRVPDRGPILIVGRAFGYDATIVFQSTLVLELRRKGLEVLTPFFKELGTSYSPQGRRFARAVEIADGTSLPVPAPVIAQVTMHTVPPLTVTIGLLGPPAQASSRANPDRAVTTAHPAGGGAETSG